MRLLAPNPDYRANPNRAIWVHGRIDQDLIDKLTPEILKLQAANRNPITVYIDSPGGFIPLADVLSRLLRASDQDYSPSCRLITVVTGRAASAAADLLCSGSYAMAYPESLVFFHGGRSLSNNPITVTKASEIMDSLRLSNEQYAVALAEKALPRFGFRYVSERPKFGQHRKKVAKPGHPDVFCLIDIIQENLSIAAKRVVTRALARNGRYSKLVQGVRKKLIKKKRFLQPAREADAEAEIIKAIVEYELAQNKGKNWKFTDSGLTQLNIDFLLLSEYLGVFNSPHLRQLCDVFGEFLLTAKDRAELGKIEDSAQRNTKRDEKLMPILRPIWMFFIALCYELQEDENELTATDVFWLGLIDEVVGRADLRPERLTLEATPEIGTTKSKGAIAVRGPVGLIAAPESAPTVK